MRGAVDSITWQACEGLGRELRIFTLILGDSGINDGSRVGRAGQSGILVKALTCPIDKGAQSKERIWRQRAWGLRPWPQGREHSLPVGLPDARFLAMASLPPR